MARSQGTQPQQTFLESASSSRVGLAEVEARQGELTQLEKADLAIVLVS